MHNVTSSNQPIFVIGCPGSGTTLLFSMLESHPNLSCGNETDFLPELSTILEGRYWNKLQDYGFDKAYWYKKLADFFDSFKMDYAQKHGKRRWVDKTPSYTSHLDLIHTLFPNCQIVHIIRDGRDVVMSARNRWGYKTAVKFTYKWREYVSSAREVGKTLSPEQYMEVRYESLVAQPEVVGKEIFNFLQEPWYDDVLKFHKSSSYKPERKYEKYVDQQRKREQSESFVYRSRVGTGQNLEPILKGLLYLYAGGLLKELGYQ